MSAPGVTSARQLRSGEHAWVARALRDLVYCAAVFLWSIVAFTVLVTGVSVTLSLIVFIVGIFVWVGFAYVVRWTTRVDRRLAGWQRGERIEAEYRRPPAPGFIALLKTVTADPQTWKDLGWLGLTSIVGFTLGLLPFAVVGVAAATAGTVGVLAAVGIGLLLVPPALALARGCATAHAALAARVLRPSKKG